MKAPAGSSVFTHEDLRQHFVEQGIETNSVARVTTQIFRKLLRLVEAEELIACCGLCDEEYKSCQCKEHSWTYGGERWRYVPTKYWQISIPSFKGLAIAGLSRFLSEAARAKIEKYMASL